MPGQEATQGFFWSLPDDCWQATWQLYCWLNGYGSFFHHGNYVAVSLFTLPCTQLWWRSTFLLGLVEMSQSAPKSFLETEKDSLTVSQTKSPVVLKFSEDINLYETSVCFRTSCTCECLESGCSVIMSIDAVYQITHLSSVPQSCMFLVYFPGTLAILKRNRKQNTFWIVFLLFFHIHRKLFIISKCYSVKAVQRSCWLKEKLNPFQ